MAIDTHVHFWKYDRKTHSWITNEMKDLQKDYLPQQLLTTMNNNGVTGCIAVQADSSELETHFLVELCKKYEFIKGVVGWVDFRNEDVERRLTYFSQYPEIRGWRHIVQDEPEDFMKNETFLRGIGLLNNFGYTYDLLIREYQLPEAIEFAAGFPDLPIVLNHCAKPDIRHQKLEPWAEHINALAQLPNVYCKLSGLFTEAKWRKWSAGEFFPYLDAVTEAFGTERLMFGSDWPVMLLSGMYVQWKSLLEKYFENFDEETKLAIFENNARRFYRLEGHSAEEKIDFDPEDPDFRIDLDDNDFNFDSDFDGNIDDKE